MSYNKEQATGDDRHNVLTVVMRQFDLDLSSGIDWVAAYHRDVEVKFFDTLRRMPSWGEDIDGQVAEYAQGLALWPRANECWSFEGGRYFGSKGLEYKLSRLVPILPKSTNHAQRRRGSVVVPLVDAL